MKQDAEDPSKQPQVDDNGGPNDATCDFAPAYDETETGWAKQPESVGTNHYRTLANQDECGAGMYVSDIFKYNAADMV